MERNSSGVEDSHRPIVRSADASSHPRCGLFPARRRSRQNHQSHNLSFLGERSILMAASLRTRERIRPRGRGNEVGWAFVNQAEELFSLDSRSTEPTPTPAIGSGALNPRSGPCTSRRYGREVNGKAGPVALCLAPKAWTYTITLRRSAGIHRGGAKPS
jgi:hypothetical protein